MVLTVITPDDRPGMRRMLAHELQHIESEVLYTNWRSGLKRAKGDFICFLEYDSAISKGSIAMQLEPFLDNPRYRKLAMVSPKIEFIDSDPVNIATMQASNAFGRHLSRVGSVGGAIIRRSSLLKYQDNLKRTVESSSYALSLVFWENGLRIMHEPQAIYHSSSKLRKAVVKPLPVPDELLSLWQRECIS